jgi:primosomal protein N' (replication factor Y)
MDDQKSRVAVLLPHPFAGPLDYTLPAGMLARPGAWVQVPLRRTLEIGVVWDVLPTLAPGRAARPVQAVLEAPPLAAVLRQFIDWVANYTLSPPGEVLAMVLHRPALLHDPAQRGWMRAPGRVAAQGATLTQPRQRVLRALAEAEPRAAVELARAVDVSASVLRGMAKAGLIVPAALQPPEPFARPDIARPGPRLSPEQAEAAAWLRAQVAARAFSVTLLEGVTGSGKTEVYMEAIAACLIARRQVLVLLPEIALAAPWLARFAARFGAAPAVWHSDLAARSRRLTWQAVAAGGAPVVVGARSALFLPFADLGLIVVDEEHEPAFKQEEGVIYHARDMAVARARLQAIPIVLASATPSLESIINVETGRYAHRRLLARHGGATLPTVTAIDLRAQPPARGNFLSPVLRAAVADTLARGEQAMLFLNRRGYAPLTLCRACGHRLECPHCTAWLVEHRDREIVEHRDREIVEHRETAEGHARGLLQCHHCGHRVPQPPACPGCGAVGSLIAVGPGVERITEEAAVAFPTARRLVMTSDTLGGAQDAAAAGRSIGAREVDLIIGTQIVAKGWHFPYLTLVGVVDADLGLGGADLRAGERSVQLLHQVGGRAGRAAAPGRVMLQTYNPEHPVMQALASGDLAGFREAEAALRRPGHWPPFGRLAAVIVTADEAVAVADACRALAMQAPVQDGLVVLGPAPAPFAMLRGRHRWRFLLKAERAVAVQAVLRDWVARVKLPRSVRIIVDIDPISFL